MLIYTNPGAWLVTTVRHRAIDRLRRDRVLADKLRLLAAEQPGEETPPRGLRARHAEPPAEARRCKGHHRSGTMGGLTKMTARPGNGVRNG